jgi:hypothetical protein
MNNSIKLPPPTGPGATTPSLPQSGNFINGQVVAQGKICVLTMHIEGQPTAWIEYNEAQLHNLIEILKLKHRSMK